MFDAHQFSKDLKIQKLNYQLGDKVDYEQIHQHLVGLKAIDLTTLTTDNQKKAFWINVYNGITNYVIIKASIQTTMKSIKGIFAKKIFAIGDLDFSLDDVEHGILRRNARETLLKGDPKLELMVDTLDYRIHFALNCGAKSCPMIAYYTSQNIDRELDIAEKSRLVQL